MKLINGNNQYPILNLPSVGKDHSNQTNPNLTPSYNKINFQIQSFPTLDYLKKYQDDSSIISSSAFNNSKSITENGEICEPVNSIVIPADIHVGKRKCFVIRYTNQRNRGSNL